MATRSRLGGAPPPLVAPRNQWLFDATHQQQQQPTPSSSVGVAPAAAPSSTAHASEPSPASSAGAAPSQAPSAGMPYVFKAQPMGPIGGSSASRAAPGGAATARRGLGPQAPRLGQQGHAMSSVRQAASAGILGLKRTADAAPSAGSPHGAVVQPHKRLRLAAPPAAAAAATTAPAAAPAEPAAAPAAAAAPTPTTATATAQSILRTLDSLAGTSPAVGPPPLARLEFAQPPPPMATPAPSSAALMPAAAAAIGRATAALASPLVPTPSAAATASFFDSSPAAMQPVALWSSPAAKAAAPEVSVAQRVAAIEQQADKAKGEQAAPARPFEAPRSRLAQASDRSGSPPGARGAAAGGVAHSTSFSLWAQPPQAAQPPAAAAAVASAAELRTAIAKAPAASGEAAAVKYVFKPAEPHSRAVDAAGLTTRHFSFKATAPVVSAAPAAVRSLVLPAAESPATPAAAAASDSGAARRSPTDVLLSARRAAVRAVQHVQRCYNIVPSTGCVFAGISATALLPRCRNVLIWNY